jgi:dihydrofolate synthase/folylpolyglutamate synthase
MNLQNNSTKINLGLERITQLLEILGNPQEKLKIIHVAGTNGKGSVCAFISTILQYAGYKIGRFTSPFLREPRDSILVQNEMMNDSVWKNYYDQLEERIAQKKSWDFGIPSSFEILTSIAFLYFAEQTVDFAIIEVGMGGRLDATNAFSKALISIITSIRFVFFLFFLLFSYLKVRITKNIWEIQLPKYQVKRLEFSKEILHL